MTNDKIVGNIRIYRNRYNEISIMDDFSTFADISQDIVSFDECMAEKVCKYILAIAKEIREDEKNG